MSNLDIAMKVMDLLESGDMVALPGLLADDFKAKAATADLNKQQAIGFLHILFAAFPDHRFNFVNVKQDGDRITCAGQETGTHKGTLDLKPLGMPVTLPPTGKSFILPKSEFEFRVAGDKVIYFGEEAVKGGGMAGILEQLGVKIPS